MAAYECRVALQLSKERLKRLPETLRELTAKGLQVGTQDGAQIEGRIDPDLLDNFVDLEGVSVQIKEAKLDPMEWEKPKQK